MTPPELPSSSRRPPRRDELEAVELFQGVGSPALEWLGTHATVHDLAVGERLFDEGDAATAMFVVLSGRLDITLQVGDQPLLIASHGPGDVSGTMPYSRMTRYSGHGEAMEPTRVLRVAKGDFPDLMARSETLGTRLVQILSSRVREATRTEQQREKMVALGKLSAGLAHELNNPAAAVGRGAAELERRLAHLVRLVPRLACRGLGEPVLAAAATLVAEARGRPSARLSALEASDREDALGEWLEERGVDEPWVRAETLVEAGLEASDLEALGEALADRDDSGEALAELLAWIEESLAAGRLATDLAAASGRMSDLLASVKAYSHMDRSPDLQPVDLVAGLESTLTMLSHAVRDKQARLERSFAPNLPPVQAHPGELNQVWTNLIDNALDAIEPGGAVTLAAERDGSWVVVRVVDDGPGIPEELERRIFEPFFTTKEVGEGTGLGLDIARRIVTQHRGQILVDSRPGRTEFAVRLPVADASAADDGGDDSDGNPGGR